MAQFNLTKQTTVATLKELFNAEFGAKLRVYSGRSQAEESATLGELGLTSKGDFVCRASLTVGSFIERMQSEFGLKVKVYTCDEWVAVLEGLTLESAGNVKKKATKADMESMVAYQRTDDAVEDADQDDNKAKAEAEAAKAAAAKAAAKKAKAETAKAKPAKSATTSAVKGVSKNEGELSGRFTINSKGDKICFSRGMLQFNPAKYEFRFAENQYDIIGKDNEKIAPNYDGWIDLFGWGTSGYMGCQPTSIKTSNYGPASGGIAGTNYDWGVYNPITNGGNKEDLWRTPTKDEWSYLINGRPNAAKLRVLCTICGIEGYMIMPDNFWDNRLRMPLNMTADSCSVNTYTTEQWSQLESIGVVFIPKMGYLDGGKWDAKGHTIWLTDKEDGSKSAYYGYFLYASDSTIKWYGRGVRLIKDVK